MKHRSKAQDEIIGYFDEQEDFHIKRNSKKILYSKPKNKSKYPTLEQHLEALKR